MCGFEELLDFVTVRVFENRRVVISFKGSCYRGV